MASTSTSSLSIASPPPPSPPQKRLSKILSGGSRRSSEAHSDNSSGGLRNSLDSLSLDKLPSLTGGHSPNREDGGRKSGNSGVRKLIPGHAKRERKRVRDEELKIAAEEASRGRSRQPSSEHDPDNNHAVASEYSGSRVPMSGTGSTSSLVTDDSDIEAPPPLTTRDSHTGYLTTTSPLIQSSSVNDHPPSLPNSTTGPHGASLEQFPSIVEPFQERSPSPKSPAALASSPVPSFTGLVDKADTLRPRSIDHKRGKSPSRRFKDVFSRSSKSARTSPERLDASLNLPDPHDLRKTSTSFGERRSSHNPDQRTPSPLRSQTLSDVPSLAAPKSAMPVLQTDGPKTPPNAVFGPPETTITPPTPTDNLNRKSLPPAPLAVKPDPEDKISADDSSNVVVSPSGNMISHRRVRSASSTHQKSKLSVSQLPPLTPTIEEIKSSSNTSNSPASRSVSTATGFFSSWVSAAQNTVSTITALTGPNNRSRSGTGTSDSSNRTRINTELKQEEPESTEMPEEKADSPKKQLAVETLGAGSLNLAQLGIDNVASGQISSSGKPPAADSTSEKEQVAAKIEDMLAKRAVSQAYERPGKVADATPVAEIPDPLASVTKSPSIYDGGTTGTLTPPNGSIFEGHTGPIQRSNSVMSKLQNRRSRGSSAATGQSVLGAMIGASTATLANPAGAGPRLSGFAMAPKQRNRTFHQQFRSVPEDDFLIEDYSCALQKDILLAGRLYISEGHICFSSNILGWVTTLIISFEEVVSVEKEYTAIVIPNAIAIQTLHARHTFRSLLSREATYDLMIGIWRVSHPDSFNKSMNHKQLAAVDEAKAEDNVANGNSGSGEISEEDSDEGSGSSGSSGSARSLGSSGSIAGSEYLDTRPLSRKPSGLPNGAPAPTIGNAAAPAAAEAATAAPPAAGATDAAQDFPGPATHAPTDCPDKATHYDKVLKDEIIPGPLGKVYSLLYGPQSGAFCRKFLEDGISKAQDLQLEDDKKGLDNDIKTRQYRYIKPLGGSIGPKQTNCITTEALDFFDLNQAVSVTCSTQTPDVPSGSAFVVKTRYCLTWAPNNQTRFQMNMTIEWSAKSWLKSPIEKGALDGQTQYGDDLVKTLKSALGRTRAATAGSKTAAKGSKKRKKSSRKDKSDEKSDEKPKEENWGVFDFARPVLGPFIAPIKPILRTDLLLTFLTIMVLWTWIRPAPSSTSLSASSRLDRLSYYNDLWAREETDLWEWLEDRAGIDSAVIQGNLQDRLNNPKEQKEREKQRKKLLKSKDVAARMREERKSIKEMEEALRITQERLDAVRAGLEKERKKS